MTLPDDVREGVQRALAAEGAGHRIETAVGVGGGCINHGARVETDGGATFFLKWNRRAPAEMFSAEADGLRALATGSPLRVPSPVALGADGSTPWLLMEYVPAGVPREDTLTRLGRGLARMHVADTVADYGWERDNWIGSLDQANEPAARWAAFWRDRRIGPQLELARSAGRLHDPLFDDLLALIPTALADVERPDLVHGDLWGGNWFVDAAGEPVLIDPAVYRGHGEVDLSMTELFGGFGADFYHAYDEIRPITPHYEAYRRSLYQLYYLLVHVNLFGGSYEAGSRRAARKVVAELR